MSLRAAAKRGAEAGLARTGVARALGSRGSALVLAYHNVVPEGGTGGADASLHLPRRRFAEQLELLVRTHEVVELPALLQPAPAGARPRAAVTFDDAYRGAVTAGVSELARRGLPATIFVAPAFVGDASFWWDAVAPADPADREQLRSRALEELGGADERVRAWARERGVGVTEPPREARAASEDELRAALRHPGITVASHSWSHPNLARTHGAALAEELARPLAWLRERFERVIPWLAYPYGLCSPEAERAVREAGYEAAVRVDGGWMPATPENRFALPRLNVPAGLSADGFRLRLAGMFCG